jgi:hypothetical protein
VREATGGRIPLARAAQLGAPGRRARAPPPLGDRLKRPSRQTRSSASSLVGAGADWADSKTSRHSGSHPAPLTPSQGGRARQPLAGPQKTKFSPVFPRRRPTLQRHARPHHIYGHNRRECKAVACGSRFAATIPSSRATCGSRSASLQSDLWRAATEHAVRLRLAPGSRSPRSRSATCRLGGSSLRRAPLHENASAVTRHCRGTL